MKEAVGHKMMSRSRALAAKTVFAALSALKERGGELPAREVRVETFDRETGGS